MFILYILSPDRLHLTLTSFTQYSVSHSRLYKYMLLCCYDYESDCNLTENTRGCYYTAFSVIMCMQRDQRFG